jgi:fatty acid desaturase
MGQRGAVEPESINVGLNVALVAFAVLVNVYQFLLLPLFLRPTPVRLITLIPCIVLSNPLWYLTHESFHGNLHPDPRINETAGRLLSILFGAPYRVLRFGHLMHHRFNGALIDRSDLYDPGKRTILAARAGYFWELCIGLYAAEMVSTLLFLLPERHIAGALNRLISGDDRATKEIRASALIQLTKREAVRAIRTDGIAAWALLVMSLILYGSFWYVLPLLVIARGFLISFANNIPHYGTSPDDVKYALNIRLSRLASLLYLHFNYHRVHHQDPRLPWTALPTAFRRSGEGFDVSLPAAALAQFKGPIPAPSTR